MKKISTKKQGFTIIEVVLVLAIAGLIFLMVFVAFPALQRNQRDAQRRQDYANLQAAVITAASNNGSFPTSISTNSMNKDGKDPQGTYTVNFETINSSATNVPAISGVGSVYVLQNAKCSGETVEYSSSSNDFAIYGYLENGTYCRSASTQ